MAYTCCCFPPQGQDLPAAMSGPQPGGSAPGGNKTGEAAAKAKAWLGKAWTASRALATNKTRLEIFVEDALNDVPWGPTGAQMNEISEASFDAEKFAQVWRVILRRFESEPAQWRRCYKALLLTEHLVKNSSQHVVQTILDACGVIEGLKGFKYLDDKGKDQGINVSNRAKELVILLGDSKRIRRVLLRTSKPSLHDLMACKSAGPKKLQDVRVNPAIASAFAGAKLAPPPAAAPSSPAKPAAAPVPIAKLAPPPAVRAAQPAQPAPPSPTSPAALAEVLGAPAQLPAAVAASPSAAASSGAGSPWSAASPMAQRGAEFDAFGSGTAAGHTAGAPFAAFPETAATKLGGSPAGVISLTASTAGTAHHADSHALPAYLFAEPTPPAYSSANSWGSHVGGAAPAMAHGSVSTAAAQKRAAGDDAADAFAEFDPFKQ
ncbi:hypothetical protein COHA_005038 [Chlorella ohadii]|uniref:ENTH domain-containing protein n=1 Tax=Chlorella ohadii TaxID=2649997 RepID=A0AAD5H5R7_9CHLO|nr:hypothetical protein COHA_005038 [Chlorella ohadii]